MRPERGGHSIAKVLLVIVSASKSAMAHQADTTFPAFWRTLPRSTSASRATGAGKPSSSSNSRSATSSGSSPGSTSPFGSDQAPSSRRAQNGPPGWTSSTSSPPALER